MSDEQIDDLGKVVLIVGIFLVGSTDIRLLFMYLMVAWLDNAIKEEVEKRTV